MERVARTKHDRHQAEELELSVALAPADHQNTDGDDRDEINSIKKCFNDCLHSFFPLFLNYSLLLAAAFAALPKLQPNSSPASRSEAPRPV